ncbi:MAG: type II toxin-antitoxin system HicA family toxin [Thermoanaerobaculales bacterium]
MTPRLRVKGKDLVSALHRAGFEVTRTKGSHHFLRHSDGRTTTVPSGHFGHGESPFAFLFSYIV